MALPLIAAAGVGAGLVAAYKYFTEDKKQNGSNNKIEKPTLTKDKEKELNFIVKLATAAAYADGNISEEEESVIKGYIESQISTYGSSDFLRSLQIEAPCDLEELQRRWEVINDSAHESLNKIIEAVIGADNQHTDCEKAFLYRCNLMFQGVPDQKLFMLTHDKTKKSSLSLDYLDPNNKPSDYLFTNTVLDEFLVVHPAHKKSQIKELIPISEFFDDSFLTNQDSELINAARIAGAKKVTIFSDSKRAESTSTDIEMNMSVNNKITSGSIASEVCASNIYSTTDNKVIVYEFEGGETSIFNKLKAKLLSPEDEILRKSAWLQHDPDLTEFVRSCFSDNKVKYFKKSISTESQRNIIFSAKIAANCKLIKVSADAKCALDRKGKIFESSEKMYEVAFELS
ncbi:DUF533 domain-containing protein [Aliivibrio finisterrensis]|uniref:DUF533 domain-containing protein n=1 Tax=Aliivibrio finisterrensis TaxID=511998 RepID=UPI00102175AA|nr:DUF533 domain-containing protein [Aliivibrio finisterrensis]RYU63769.1 DUF533 domain-containing protein [Aliivibrio finisterrensis]RYU67066.1 DUF533 domain-containing protein [Aliivibrio finisterrensis]RYU70169.1 DUF533 domain-containing protein [Aliivibrio finisterrensis]